MTGKFCRRSFSSDNSSRLARRAALARCYRSIGATASPKHDASENACRRPATRRSIYSIRYRYMRNANSVNYIWLLCRFTRRTASTYPVYNFTRVRTAPVTNDEHVSVGGGRDRCEIKFLQGLLHAAKRSATEVRRTLAGEETQEEQISNRGMND